MEAINEIIARSQTQAQNMLAAGGYFDETLRSITTPRGGDYNNHNNDGSPDTSIASDFSFNSVPAVIMTTYPSQAKSPRKQFSTSHYRTVCWVYLEIQKYVFFTRFFFLVKFLYCSGVFIYESQEILYFLHYFLKLYFLWAKGQFQIKILSISEVELRTSLNQNVQYFTKHSHFFNV